MGDNTARVSVTVKFEAVILSGSIQEMEGKLLSERGYKISWKVTRISMREGVRRSPLPTSLDIQNTPDIEKVLPTSQTDTSELPPQLCCCHECSKTHREWNGAAAARTVCGEISGLEPAQPPAFPGTARTPNPT